MPDDIKATLRDGLNAYVDQFGEMLEAYDDYSEEEIAEFERKIQKASDWLEAH